MAKNYNELLEELKTNKEKTKQYLQEKENHLGKAKEMLSEKEKELESTSQYLYLLMNVVQGLKTEIKVTELELDSLRLQLDGISGYEKSIIETNEKLSGLSKKVEKGNLSQSQKPEMRVLIQSVNDIKKKSESLSNIEDDGDNSILKTQNTNLKQEDTKDWVKSASSSTEDKDLLYISFIEEHCKKPDDITKIDIWRRRVLVKHYLESGLSTVSEVMTRYNKYAKKVKVSLGTESSISKDILKVFSGEFKLDVLVYDKRISSVFKPSSMLTSNEICQINQMINQMQKQSQNKINVINKVQSYAKDNMNNMSVYKLRAVKSFIEEQLS